MTEQRSVKVFLASPADLAPERAAFRDQLAMLNLGFRDGAGTTFLPLGWETVLASTGRRPQALINSLVDGCDVFVLAMHRRWGQPAPDSQYDSYTEEEFHRALDRCKATAAPEIFVLFKNVDAASMADPGPQLSRVLAFRRQLEDSRLVLYRTFEDENAFRQEIDLHLRAYAKGDTARPTQDSEHLVLPTSYVDRLTQAEAEARQQTARANALNDRIEAATARAEELALALAKEAIAAAALGRVEEARQSLAKAIEGTTSTDVLATAAEFYLSTREFAQAQDTLEHWLALDRGTATPAELSKMLRRLGDVRRCRHDPRAAVAAYQRAIDLPIPASERSHLGLLYDNLGETLRSLGDLKGAESAHRKALEIETDAKTQDGIARATEGLANALAAQGDIPAAEEMYTRLIGTAGLLPSGDNAQRLHGNLAALLIAKGELQTAEGILREGIDVNARTGNRVALAGCYLNLGNALQYRGKLSDAEVALHNAVALLEDIGDTEGLADAYLNLGVVLKAEGKVGEAEVAYQKALAIAEQLGRRLTIATALGNIANIVAGRGHLQEAEGMLRRALAIDEEAGHMHGMINNYCNLANVLRRGGEDLSTAEALLQRALAISERIGRQEAIAKVSLNIAGLELQRGEPQAAEPWAIRARDVFVTLGNEQLTGQADAMLSAIAKDLTGTPGIPPPKEGADD